MTRKIYLCILSIVAFIFVVLCYFFVGNNQKSNNASTENIEIIGQLIYLKDKNNTKVERTIDVAFSSDDNYAKHLATAMASILLNSDSSSYFRFHILDGGISERNKHKIQKLKNLRPFDIHFYDMSRYNWKDFELTMYGISLATYYRLFLAEILPQYVEKIVYLDCDIVVEQDLKFLWNVDVSNFALAAVEDAWGMIYAKQLNINRRYFNAGVLLLNLSKLRESNFFRQALKYYNENKEIIKCQDQDILNGVLGSECKFLPLNWNWQIYSKTKFKIWHFTSDDEINNARSHPYLIHFTSSFSKPWLTVCKHPLQGEYYKYLQYTDFKKKSLGVHSFNEVVEYYKTRLSELIESCKLWSMVILVKIWRNIS